MQEEPTAPICNGVPCDMVDKGERLGPVLSWCLGNVPYSKTVTVPVTGSLSVSPHSPSEEDFIGIPVVFSWRYHRADT